MTLRLRSKLSPHSFYEVPPILWTGRAQSLQKELLFIVALLGFDVVGALFEHAVWQPGQLGVMVAVGNIGRKSVLILPVRTLWACLALWVVDPFFVRATEQILRHNEGCDFMLLDASEDIPLDRGVITSILRIRKPLGQRSFVVIVLKYTEDDLRRFVPVLPVECNGGSGPAAVSLFRATPEDSNGLHSGDDNRLLRPRAKPPSE